MPHENYDDSQWSLLARYFAGECSPAERADVERWAAASPERAADLEALRAWWENATMLPSAAHIDAMWQGLTRRIRAADARATDRPRLTTRPTPRQGTPVLPLVARAPARLTRRWITASAIAAGIIATVGGTLVWRSQMASREAGSVTLAARAFVTARGQRATVRLADGTRVELGYASTLRVRPFVGGRRELDLEGEAVFDVVHDPRRPFIVRAANAVTEDLGTSFAIRAYPREQNVRVVVMSGKVAVRPTNARAGDGKREAVLGPGQLARLSPAGQLEVIAGVDTTEYLGWLSERVTYRNVRLDEVAQDLERKFDVTVRIPDSAVASKRVTVDVPTKSLDDLLDAIAAPYNLRHRRDAGGAIVLER
jgi:transmembrane sensor